MCPSLRRYGVEKRRQNENRRQAQGSKKEPEIHTEGARGADRRSSDDGRRMGARREADPGGTDRPNRAGPLREGELAARGGSAGKALPRGGQASEAGVETYCAGCFHFCISGMQTHCDYIGNTGHCRPCPAGEGCTERITPAEWRKKNESVRVEFNGYYPELRQKRDAGER